MDEERPRDLSGTDSEELRAFNEKRRWFEARLQRLDALPILYPFGIAFQEHSTDDGSRPHHVPTADQLTQLQQERDEMEDEVLAFDDGDLVRMKEKTRRAVTLIPLTPPSTDLVSVTLALILVVDRLLTLLRQRAELLELCQLRLQWEALRQHCSKEITQVQVNMDGITQSYCAWYPRSEEPCNPDPVERSSALAIQSTIHSLSSTDIASCGAILDRMIDIAAPLRTLPGLAGTHVDGASGGAVPIEFLDMQDRLEARAADSAAEARWYLLLEQRRDLVQTHQYSMMRARQAASVILGRIEQYADGTRVDASEAASLAEELDQVSKGLAPALDDFDCRPCSQHTAVGQHDDQLVVLANTQRKDTQSMISKTRAHVDWFRRLTPCRAGLALVCTDLVKRRAALDDLLLAIPFAVQDHVTLVAVEQWLERSTATLDELSRGHLVKHATVALMKYRAARRARPEWSMASDMPSDELEEEVDGLLAELTSRKDRLVDALVSVKDSRDLDRRLSRYGITMQKVHDDLAGLQTEVVAAVDDVLLSKAARSPPASHSEWRSRLGHLDADIAQLETDFADPFDSTAVASRLTERHGTARCLVHNVRRTLLAVETTMNLYHRAKDQALHVMAVSQEAETLLRAIVAESVTPSALSNLHEEVEAWEANVTARTIFIDIYASQTPSVPTELAHRSVFPVGLSSTAPPLTPPPSPPPLLLSVPLDRWDLAAVDRAVRDQINDLTARVRGRLASLSHERRSTAGVPPPDSLPDIPPTLLDADEAPGRLANQPTSDTSSPARRLPLAPVLRSVSMRSIGSSASQGITPSRRIASRSNGDRESRPSAGSAHSQRKYVANDSNQLDRAVGELVNKMPNHVPIKPVGRQDRHEWTDVTGSYWIGAEGRAKLCFCRILRSKTVMVRVGGGWTELSQYLADHFGDSLTIADLSIDDSPLSSDSIPTTPHRHATSGSLSMTASLSRTSLSRSTSSRLSLSVASGSPLEPLRFMRKTSDSPDDRRLEKDRLKVGRRSIIGKEA